VISHLTVSVAYAVRTILSSSPIGCAHGARYKGADERKRV